MTYLYADNSNKDGADIQTWLDALDDGNSTSVRGRIRITKMGTPATYHDYNVSGAVVDGTGYRKIPVTYVSGNGSLSDTDRVVMSFAFAGVSGYSGISGYSGAVGTSGFSGISGYSGYSGISGYSGGPNNMAQNIGKLITQAGHGFAVGNVIYYTGSAYAKAQADTAAKAEAIGVVDSVNGDDFVVVQAGLITTISGLSAGTVYYLDPSTAGAYTSTEPSTAGQVSKPVLIAVSSTAAWVVTLMRGDIIPA